MQTDSVLFWFLCLACLSGIVRTLIRFRAAGRGWVAILAAILLVCVLGRLREQNAWIYGAGAMFAALVLLPGLLGKLYYRRFLQQRYSDARRLAQVLSWLHPADGWRQQPQLMAALELAERGDFPGAMEKLRRFETTKSQIGLAAMANVYRLTQQWHECLAWEARHRQELARHPHFLPVLLRARGETGDVSGLVALYVQHQRQIGQLSPAFSRDHCRLMLFAFCGKRELVEQLFAGSMAIYPAPVREFWLATADLTAGRRDLAQRQLESLLPSAAPPMRLALEHRLAGLTAPPASLDAAAEKAIQAAAVEHSHEENFGTQRTLFSKQARATQALLALNVLLFVVEVWFGGSTDIAALYRLGGLFPPAVLAGEWWRLGTSLFLHFGALHLAMNMFALWLLGPFVEFALGFSRFLLLYLLAGIGSMGVVIALATGPRAEQLTVGASGCIMGLIGATGALMLRGWLRHKAISARRRLAAMVLIIAMQTVFDAMVPGVSMTAHLSGATIGFLATLLLRDRVKAWTPGQSLPEETTASTTGVVD